MSNTRTDTKVNPIGIPPNGNVTVSTVTLEITGNFAHQILVAGQFSADCVGAVGGIVVASILVDGNLHLNAQVNDLNGNTGTLLSLSGIVSLTGGKHQLDLTAFAENLQFLSAHHCSLSAVDLDSTRVEAGIFDAIAYGVNFTDDPKKAAANSAALDRCTTDAAAVN